MALSPVFTFIHATNCIVQTSAPACAALTHTCLLIRTLARALCVAKELKMTYSGRGRGPPLIRH